jgi:1,4-dihydroxy-2-naphthoate polyprenyltransferase
MSTYERLTPKAVFSLVVPQAWISSILPVLTGAMLSIHYGTSFSPTLFYMLLATAILMQAAANCSNNYCDFRNKTDQLENCDSPEQSILVKHKFRQRDIILLIIGILIFALGMGIWLVLMRGIALLIIGLIGGVTLVLYSAGPFPICRTPLGELVSGLVMGGLIPLAVYTGMNGTMDFHVLLLAIPSILTVSLMMMTNNLCDMEKDRTAGRRTLPIVIGKYAARAVYRMLITISFASVYVLVILHFSDGAFLLGFFTVHVIPVFLRLWHMPDILQPRHVCMGSMLKFNLLINFYYIAMIGLDALL